MRVLRRLSVLLIALAVMAGCSPATTPEIVTVEKEVAVEKPVVQTVVVEKEVAVEKQVIETVVVEKEKIVEKTVVVEVEKETVVTATPEPRSSVLRFGIGYSDLGTMDPHLASSTGDRPLVDMIFNGLIRYKPGESTIFEPDLAVAIPEPEIVDGKQVWVFELKQGVMVHPSDVTPSYELTSEDVVYSLQKAADPERSAYSSEYDGMTFEALDTYTVQITLDNPLSSLLFFPKIADYAGGFIIPKQPIEAMGDDAFKTHAVGTGPFMVEEYQPQKGVTLVANEDYFRGKPLLSGVEYMYVAEINSREFALAAGELDVIGSRGEDQRLDQMAMLPDTIVDIFGVAEVVTLHFNWTEPPLDDLRVRQALAYATSRDELLAMFSQRVWARVYSPVPEQFLNGGLTQEEVSAAGVEYAVDRDKAKELLAEAGYPDGFSLDVFVSESSSYKTTYEKLAGSVGRGWRETQYHHGRSFQYA